MPRKTTTIRSTIKTTLEGLGIFTNVYDGVVTALDPDTHLPAAVVTLGVGVYDNPFNNKHILIPARIEIYLKTVGIIEDDLDTLAESVENAFVVGDTLGGLVKYMIPESFDYTIDKDSGLGSIGLNYNIKYEV